MHPSKLKQVENVQLMLILGNDPFNVKVGTHDATSRRDQSQGPVAGTSRRDQSHRVNLQLVAGTSRIV